MDLAVLVLALGVIWALRELDVFDRIRRATTQKRLLSVGGFTVGLIWGQAIIAAAVGALSGLAAMAATNLAGITNLSLEAMATITFAIGLVYVFIRMGD